MSEIEINSGGTSSSYGTGTITGVIGSEGISGTYYSGVASISINHSYNNEFLVGQKVTLDASGDDNALILTAIGGEKIGLTSITSNLDSVSIYGLSSYGLPGLFVSSGISFTLDPLGYPTTTPIVSEALRLVKDPSDVTQIGTGVLSSFYVNTSDTSVSTKSGSVGSVLIDPLAASFSASMVFSTPISSALVDTLKLYGYSALLQANGYLNFGTVYSEPGYGIRDYFGKIQFKNNSGVWADIGAGSGSSSVRPALHYSMDGHFLNLEPDGSVSGIFVGRGLFVAGPVSGPDSLISLRTIEPDDLPVIPIMKGGTGETTSLGALMALLPSAVPADGNKVLALNSTATTVGWMTTSSSTGGLHSDLSSGSLEFGASGHFANTTAVKNTFIAGPVGSSGPPSFRSIDLSDLPDIPITEEDLPLVPIHKGGTGSNTAAAAAIAIMPVATSSMSGKALTVNPGGEYFGWNDLTDDVLPIVPISKGGTGQSVRKDSILALLPSITDNENKLLSVNSDHSDVEWIAPPTTSSSVSVHSALTALGFEASGHLAASSYEANKFMASPDLTSGNVSFRNITKFDLPNITKDMIPEIESEDLPAIPEDKIPTIPIYKGGTGAITAVEALNALLPTQDVTSVKYLSSSYGVPTWSSTTTDLSNYVDRSTNQTISTGTKTFSVKPVFTNGIQLGTTATLLPSSLYTSYTLPNLPNVLNYYLTSNTTGTLSWVSGVDSLVLLSGNQTIGGVKTFSSTPIVTSININNTTLSSSNTASFILPPLPSTVGTFLTCSPTTGAMGWASLSGMFVDLATSQTIASGVKTFNDIPIFSAGAKVNYGSYYSLFKGNPSTAKSVEYTLPVGTLPVGSGPYALSFNTSNVGSVGFPDTTTLEWRQFGAYLERVADPSVPLDSTKGYIYPSEKAYQFRFGQVDTDPWLSPAPTASSFLTMYSPDAISNTYGINIYIPPTITYSDVLKMCINTLNSQWKTYYKTNSPYIPLGNLFGGISIFGVNEYCCMDSSAKYNTDLTLNGTDSDYRLGSPAIAGVGDRGTYGLAARTQRPLTRFYTAGVCPYSSTLDKRYVNDLDGPSIGIERLSGPWVSGDPPISTTNDWATVWTNVTQAEFNGYGVSADFYAAANLGSASSSSDRIIGIDHGSPHGRIKMCWRTGVNATGTYILSTTPIYPSFEFYLSPKYLHNYGAPTTGTSKTRFTPLLPYAMSPTFIISAGSTSASDGFPMENARVQGNSYLGSTFLNKYSTVYGGTREYGALSAYKYSNQLPSVGSYAQVDTMAICAVAYGITPTWGFGPSFNYITAEYSASADGYGTPTTFTGGTFLPKTVGKTSASWITYNNNTTIGGTNADFKSVFDIYTVKRNTPITSYDDVNINKFTNQAHDAPTLRIQVQDSSDTVSREVTALEKTLYPDSIYNRGFVRIDKFIAGQIEYINYASGGSYASIASPSLVTINVSNTLKGISRSASHPGSFLTEGFAIGNYVLLKGFSNSANNIYGLITNVTATTMTFGFVSTLVNESCVTAMISETGSVGQIGYDANTKKLYMWDGPGGWRLITSS